MDIADLLRHYNVPTAPDNHRNVRSGWTGVQCPNCEGATGGSFYAAFAPGGFGVSCWRCGRLPLAKTLMQLTNQPWHVVKDWLGSLDRPTIESVPRGKLILPKGTGPLLPAHKSYLESRGLNADNTERLWDLQGIGIAQRLAWRVLVPITHNLRVVSWTTRAIGNQEPRYWTAEPHEEEMNHRHLLHGSDYARHAIIIQEGPLDRIRTGPGAVDTGGLGYTPEQLLAMCKFPLRAVCFDSEPEAQQKAKVLCADLAVFPGRTIRVELDAKDPGSASDKEIAQLRRIFLGD
jgi:hypothetical protein